MNRQLAAGAAGANVEDSRIPSLHLYITVLAKILTVFIIGKVMCWGILWFACLLLGITVDVWSCLESKG